MSKMFKSNEKINNFKEKVKYLFKNPKILFKEFFFSFIWLSIILILIDVITKVCAENYLSVEESIIIIPHLLKFTLTYNNGAAWGMGGDATWSRILLALISWAVAIFIIFFIIFKYDKLNRFLKATMMIILARDVGNLIDRTFFYERGVIDFMDITPLIKGFGIFNFADSCLVIGILMLITYYIIDYFKEIKEEKNNKEIVNKNNDDSKK